MASEGDDNAATATTTGGAGVKGEDKEQDDDSPSHTATSNNKIDLLLKPTGDAPIMKKRKWAVERCKKMASIIEFMRKYLHFEPHESLFVYVNQSFAPAPDVDVGILFDCFGTDGKLVLHYCRTQAWG